MVEYKIEVKPWMLKKSSDGFDFMEKWNNDIPMPLMIMYGVKLQQTAKMVKMKLHGDIKQRTTGICMCCGRPITNKISQYFGIGPKCGGHNYVNPFSTQEELDNAVKAYREKLVNTVWTGWIPVSAIVAIDDDCDAYGKLAEMPIVTEESSATKSSGKANTSDKYVFTVNARIDKPVKGTDDYSVFLSFRYNESVKDAIKALRVHIWDGDKKEWEIEYKEFDALQKTLPKIKFNISNQEIIPDKVELTDTSAFKTKPMAHQVEGVEYGLNHNRWLLADDQGLGKTKQIIDLAIARKNAGQVKHCLIICGVNSLKWNWLEEIKKHSDENGWILGMYRKNYKTNNQTWGIGSNKDKLEDLNKLGTDAHLDSHFFLITNVESLRDENITAKLKELCDNGTIGMVAIDECHRCKNLKTQQGTGMLQLQPTYKIAMTGTPLINTPLDLYSILKWLGYQRYGFVSFRDHFCYRDEWGKVIGYKNIDQLQNQLDSIMLRRTKDKVLDLPDKVYVNEYVELTDEQRRLYNQVIEDAIASSNDMYRDEQECVLVTKLKLRQVSGGIGSYDFIKKNPKLDRLEQLVEEAVYSGTKVIVYSNWVEGIKPAFARLKKYNPVVITGETKDADRQAIVNRFQTDDSVKVILGTIGALGTGLTLTAATEVIFLDEPWNEATKEQACDRAYRIGTTSTVTIHTIMSYGTYDEDVHLIVTGKGNLSRAIVDKDSLALLRI